MRRSAVKDHIERVESREIESPFPGGRSKQYDVFQCKHCEKEFRTEAGTDRGSMYSYAGMHLEDEHPNELEREPYPNEAVFREWADANGHNVIDPHESGASLVVSYGDGRQVELYPDGEIVLKAWSHLGGANDGDEVRLMGKRLVVDTNRGWGYVSNRAFPLDH